MRIPLDRRLLPGLIILMLAGCTSTATPSGTHDFPLFTSQDGNAELSVRVVDARRLVQDYADLEGADRVRFTLSSATALASSRVATSSITIQSSQQFTNVFTKLRPATDYVLKADLYKQTDLDTLGGESLFASSIVRGEGLSGTLTLTAGAATTATLKVNSVGTIAFSGSTNSNVVSDFVVVEGDSLTVDSGMTSTNNPLVRRIELTYRSANGTLRGSTVSTTTIGGTAVSFTWPVPTFISSGTTDTGTLYVTGYDQAAGGNQIAFKTKTVTIYKAASVTPVTLN